MRAYSSMPTSDFVAQLRDIAIKANARPLVIDQIEAILLTPSEDEIEKLESKAFEDGQEDGRSDCASEWRKMRKHKILHDLDAIDGLTEEQYAKVLEAIDRMEPEV